MNLIVRITILFVFVSGIVFLIGGVISYRVMMREVRYEQERFLVERLERMERVVENNVPDDTIRWTKLMAIPLRESREESRIFSDTIVMHSQLDRLESHLKLDAIKNVGDRSYLISLYDIIIEPDDIQDGVVESLVTMYLILLGSVLIIALAASFYILRPFNNTLAVINKFSLKDQDQQLHFPRSSVSEFKRLNQFLTRMTEKVRSDYRALKEFTENASHEMQTPIAIIQSKLEVLLDAENLTSEQLDQISFIQNSVKRLGNMSNALLTLTRIENKEFSKDDKLDLSDILTTLVGEFEELFELKSISKKVDIEQGVTLQADKILIELLITNLINNAIRHNWEKGDLNIALSKSTLIISNTGPKLDFDPSLLFHRFKKSNQSSKSLGLGLAIVKKICDFYGFQIEYEQINQLHTVKIIF
jgi:signal transduction histidine kinase